MRRAKRWWQDKDVMDNVKVVNIQRVFGRPYDQLDANANDIGFAVPQTARDAITQNPIKPNQMLVDFNHESAFDRYYTIDTFNKLLRMAGNNPVMATNPITRQPIDPDTIQPGYARPLKKGGIVRKRK
jgi:hypothetical protein